MVGFTKNETMTPNQKLIAGCVSGVMTRFVTQPLDVIKLKTQLQKQKALARKRRLWKTSKKIYFEEGLRAFYHGHVLGQIHTILSVGTQFYVYELTTRLVQKSPHIEKKHRTKVNFFCGILAGCFSCTIVSPLEVIRVRQIMAKNQYKGMWNGAKVVYKSGGILGFFEGLSASLLQMGPQVGISFGVFRSIQPQIMKFLANRDCEGGICPHGTPVKAKDLILASTVAGSMAGFISKTLTYPLDLAKRRMQIGSHQSSEEHTVSSTSKHLIKCKVLTECVKKTFKKEGFIGLYRGWLVTVSKAQLSSIVAFTTYEIICFAMRPIISAKV